MIPNIGEIWKLDDADEYLIISTRPLTEKESQDRYGRYGFQGAVIMQNMTTKDIQPYHWPAEENLSHWVKVFP